MKLLNYLLIAIFVFTSCKSTKEVASVSSIKKLSSRKVAKKHLAEEFKEETVDTKLKLNYANNKNQLSLSVRMKIKKNEVIWLKGTKLITVFKAKITPEKVSFYSPFQKIYFEENFTSIKKVLGADISFKQLQNILLGETVIDIKSERQNIDITSNSYKLSPKQQNKLFDLFFFINPKHYKLDKQSVISSLKNQRLDISYPSYSRKNNVLFPDRINILAKENNKFTKIEMIIRSVDFNTNPNFSFSIPKGYKEIQL